MNANTQPKTKRHLTVAGILLAIWAAAAWFFYAPTAPLRRSSSSFDFGWPGSSRNALA